MVPKNNPPEDLETSGGFAASMKRNQTFLPNFSFKKKSLSKRNTKEERKEKFDQKK